MRSARQALVWLCVAMTVLVVVMCLTLPSFPQMMKDYPFTRSPKFVKENFTLTIEGPTVNPVVGQITWLEDLSWRDPPVCNESAPFILAAVITAVENFERRAWEEYPLEHYPPIVLGSAYIVDRNAVDVLLAYVPYVPMLWLEDVFLTGLVAKRAGINLKQAERKLYAWRLTRRFYYGSQAFLLDPKKNEVKQAWQKIVRYSNKSISKLKSGYYNGV
ncbi:Beta-1,3-galactosyltransferase brn [Portunus trituberculatus]|uniref:Beta-1,3-galactosyltransferase brn n=1 Tax=Portunus trituberculatus TaxID=210409 RepID=A0A5B7G4B8_PORTR|nr:Beta-1,3-galactosyltransferase brn [Portunus trituberculatus]